MTTLAASSNVTLALTDYDSVTISCRGPVMVEAVSGLGVTDGKIAEVQGTRTLGPFTAAGSLKLTTQGAPAEYEVANGEARGGAVEYSIINGQVTGLAGPGGTYHIGRAAAVVLDNATTGATTGWLPASANPERFGFQLLIATGGSAASITIDGSNDGTTSAGQVATISLDTTGTTLISAALKPLYPFIRFTVVSAGSGTVQIARGM